MRVIEDQQTLGVLRIKGDLKSVYVADKSSAKDLQGLYEGMFDRVFWGAMTLSPNCPGDIASLGLLGAALDPEILRYVPEKDVVIKEASWPSEKAYKYDSSFHEATVDLIQAMLSQVKLQIRE